MPELHLQIFKITINTSNERKLSSEGIQGKLPTVYVPSFHTYTQYPVKLLQAFPGRDLFAQLQGQDPWFLKMVERLEHPHLEKITCIVNNTIFY